MAFNKSLAQVIRDNTENIPEIVEKKMFGGVAFMLNGNMSIGVHKDFLVIRVNPELHREFLKEPNISEFNITGRSMKGWLMLSPEGQNNEEYLNMWINRGLEFAKTLPPK